MRDVAHRANATRKQHPPGYLGEADHPCAGRNIWKFKFKQIGGKMKILVKQIITFGIVVLMLSATGFAAPVVRQGSRATAAAIQAIVDTFRADLGGANNGVGGSFTNGRREINWDGVPDNFSEPNNLPTNFFNVNTPRGILFKAIET